MKLGFKDVILCAVCGNNVAVVYPNSKGNASVQCNRCERLLLIDCDKMRATQIPHLIYCHQ